MSIGKVNNVSFTSSPNALNAEAQAFLKRKNVEGAIKKALPQIVKRMTKLNEVTSGEVPNILINALGTGLVAPIFIKYNFLSKTDEDTRTYSAWRQPVSAVLAVITQAGVTIPFDKYIMKTANIGGFSNPMYNKTPFPDEGFIARNIQKLHPEYDKDQLKNAVREEQARLIHNMVETMKEKNTLEYTLQGKTVQMSEDEFRKLLHSAIDDMEKTSKKVHSTYVSEKFEKKFNRGEFYRTYQDKVLKELEAISHKLSGVEGDKAQVKFIDSQIKLLKKKNAHPELLTILQDMKGRRTAEQIKIYTEETIDACKEYGKCSSINETIDKVTAHIKSKLKTLADERGVLKRLREMIHGNKPINVKQLLEEAENIKDERFLFEVAQKHIANIEKNVNGFKQMNGLVVSLAMLPITCTLLNILYPKFMDFAFPNLSKAKKAKSGDKFTKNTQAEVVKSIDQTTMKQEVK